MKLQKLTSVLLAGAMAASLAACGGSQPAETTAAPAAEAPVAETLTAEAPAAETLTAEAPATEALAEVAPAAEALTVEAPAAEVPVAEALTAEAPEILPPRMICRTVRKNKFSRRAKGSPAFLSILGQTLPIP